MASRLFRSIVVFGTSIGAGAALGPGCDLAGGGGDDEAEPDARTDAWFGIIDAPMIIDAEWGIIDASTDAAPDAAPDAEPPPDGAIAAEGS